MDSILGWLLNQQPLGWVLFFATVIGVATLIVFDKLHTSGQVERERERDKETLERQDAALVRKDDVIAELVADKKASLENEELIIKLIKSMQAAAARRRAKP